MDQDASNAIKEFFAVRRKLSAAGVIRSKHYIDDIGDYLCASVYNYKLADKDVPYDCTDGKSKVKVIISNCPHGRPVELSDLSGFDRLVVILGPDCALRPDNIDADFIFYRFSTDEIKQKFTHSDGNYQGNRETFREQYDKVLSLN